jgi:hypothetical protein
VQSFTQKQVALSTDTCPHCGGLDLFTESRPPHVALVCRSCSRWIRWVRKNRAQTFPAKSAKPSPLLALAPHHNTEPASSAVEDSPNLAPPTAGRTCDHSQQLDLLIQSLNRVDRNLEIVSRALINGVVRRKVNKNERVEVR